MAALVEGDNRWELYKVLGEPQRLRLLALAAVEELAIGELAELLADSQPNVSRHLAPLRRLGVLAERKQGTRVFVRVADDALSDPVVNDALEAGRALCEPDGTLERIALVIKRRDAHAREFFASVSSHDADDAAAYPAELPAYLCALAPLIPRRRLAIDVGTGHGPLLDVLAPIFERVVAVDREPAQLARAASRAEQRGYGNVQLYEADLHEPESLAGLQALGSADAVFASRVLHHAPRPAETVARLAELLSESGMLIILDYTPHHDETMREQQADLWLGFSPEELRSFARKSGLADLTLSEIPLSFHGTGLDHRLGWQVLSARRAKLDNTAPNPGKTEN